MKIDSMFSPDESAQEIALRATLHEHASVDVDVDHVWTVVSQRLYMNRRSSTHSTVHALLQWFPGKRSYPLSLKGRLMVGAIAFVVIVVASINIMFPFLPGSDSVGIPNSQPICLVQVQRPNVCRL